MWSDICDTLDATRAMWEADIEKAATDHLKVAVDDYDSRIWDVIRKDVIDDVIECSGIREGDGYSHGDVVLAIGRAICCRLGIEA